MKSEIDSIDREFGELGADCAKPMLIELGGYQIVREISHGGQAVVYQAIQRSTHRKVAMEGRLASKSARKRFEREVEIVAQLKHPNIVSIFDSGGAPAGACDMQGCGQSLDCDGPNWPANGIPDECDIADCGGDPGCGGCNLNGVPDGCDIRTGASMDVAPAEGVPDECAQLRARKPSR